MKGLTMAKQAVKALSKSQVISGLADSTGLTKKTGL
jgi:hypothetical protein